MTGIKSDFQRLKAAIDRNVLVNTPETRLDLYTELWDYCEFCINVGNTCDELNNLISRLTQIEALKSEGN